MTSPRRAGVHDHVALDEIEMCGDLMIAASSSGEDRLTPARIDEVLKVARPDGPDPHRVPLPRNA
ncbi:hypothetical protein [Streptacidiphilus sp. ASG 303]|uniref:hypothetical protein n=1 Tax=Streptomycetaceae TaxID=2062 RepID=UPI001E2D4A2E|nr:hypothetical protein [Streptacidiphilus sp. ASG 303]MCD0485612.1 hypothetical protein [Streptacidiphilus sp. ASG 303]